MQNRNALSVWFLNGAFIALLALVALYYQYPEIAFKRPQSIHKWRQSDCASLALNYYRYGMNWFEPRTHNYTSDGGTTSYACPSELPVLYYSVAFLYKIFGPQDSVYRIFNTLLFLLGLFYLFRLTYLVLEDFLWSAGICLLVFASPILVYYGNNFLSNSNALAFSFIGWYYFLKYEKHNGTYDFSLSVFAFLLASCFKLTGLLSVFSILLYALFFSRHRFFENEKRSVKLLSTGRFIVISLIPLIIGFWTVYASWFNRQHDCSYFSTTTFPIWSLDQSGIGAVLENVSKLWLPQYFHPLVLYILLAGLIYGTVRYRRIEGSFFMILFFILFQLIFFILLQFWNFADHDYYVIELYIFPALLLVYTAYLLKHHVPIHFKHPGTAILLIVFVLFNVAYAKSKLNERYHSWMNDFDQYKDVYDITPKLRQLGIHEEDKVIFISDPSHASLYLMDQPGWTTYTDARFNKAQKIPYNQDSSGIAKSIRAGAKFMVVNGMEELQKRSYIHPFCRNLKARIANIFIFDLLQKDINFEWNPDKIKRHYQCNAEHRSLDGQYFIDTAAKIQFEFGLQQTSIKAHSGKFAIKLTGEQPFGMTFKLKELEAGDRIHISIWRFPDNRQSAVWISSIDETKYYNNSVVVSQTDANGWQQIVQEFTIDSSMAGKELKLYAFNPSGTDVYFDDLEVLHYHNPMSLK